MRSFLKAWRDWRRFKTLPARERAIVFYAEDAAAMGYWRPLLETLVRDHGSSICYLTSGINDPVLTIPPAGVKPFYIGDGMVRTLAFMQLDAAVAVMTMPDLERFHLKRSRAADVHYVYLFHSMVSTHMIYRQGAFDHYDVVLCVGPHHVREIAGWRRMQGRAPAQMVHFGYPRLSLFKQISLKSMDVTPGVCRILIAPSWGEQGLLEMTQGRVIDELLKAGHHVTVRPHPMTGRRHPEIIDEMRRLFHAHPCFVLETNITDLSSFWAADLMISDWSGAALEFAFVRRRPVIFADTPPKINNPEFKRLDMEPMEMAVRSRIGVVVPAEPKALAAAVTQMRGRIDDFASQIDAVREEFIFDHDAGVKAGAAYIALRAGGKTGL